MPNDTLDLYIKQHPEDISHIHYIIGRRYLLQNKYMDAVAELKKALDTCTNPDANPEIKEVRFRLMDSYFASGAYKKGDALLNDLVAKYPNDSAALYCVTGRRYQLQNRFNNAIDYFSKAASFASSTVDNDVENARERLLDCYLAKNEDDIAKK
jgi:tetratricopeptide (TPR) repeat protein